MKTKMKRLFGILVGLVMMLGLLPGMSLTAYAEDHNHVGWTEWDSSTGLPDTSGNYYLTKNVTLSNQWTVPEGGTTNLCLNGHTIKYSGNFQVIYIGSNATLNLYDETASGEITHEVKISYGVINDGTFNMYGGTIHNNEYGVKNNNASGIFTMSGGTISGNKKYGVYNTAGTFTMSNGTISGNYDTGVYINSGKFTMSGGTISDNNSTGKGGGVYNKGTFTMSGGTITKNTASSGGGVLNSSTFNMSGGTISYNEATNFDGGGVYNIDTFNMTGGTITNNTAKSYGGGVANYNTFTMSGGTISENKATGSEGGGVSNYFTFELSGNPKITGNTANNANNNVYLYKNITITGVLTEGASVGVNMNPVGTFTSGYNTYNGETAPSKYFSSDDSTYAVNWTSDNKEATLSKASTCEVTYKVVNGTWSDGSTTDKTETVTVGGTPVQVPTGMKAGSGYTGGAWDKDPATAIIKGATTFTYTFEAIPVVPEETKVEQSALNLPKTGDTAHPLLWFAMILAGLLCIVGAIAWTAKKHR